VSKVDSLLRRLAWSVDHTPSSLPQGSLKWKRRPPGKLYGSSTTWPPPSGPLARSSPGPTGPSSPVAGQRPRWPGLVLPWRAGHGHAGSGRLAQPRRCPESCSGTRSTSAGFGEPARRQVRLPRLPTARSWQLPAEGPSSGAVWLCRNLLRPPLPDDEAPFARGTEDQGAAFVALAQFLDAKRGRVEGADGRIYSLTVARVRGLQASRSPIAYRDCLWRCWRSWRILGP